MLEGRVGSEVTSVGIARANIRNVPGSSELAFDLVEARLREELKSPAQKTARADVEGDLILLQQLLESKPRRPVHASSLSAVTSGPAPSVAVKAQRLDVYELPRQPCLLPPICNTRQLSLYNF